MISDLVDFIDLDEPSLGDRNFAPVKLRSAMTSASNTSPQGRLWTGQSINCSLLLQTSESGSLPMNCVLPNMFFGNMSILPDPFLAELPSGYSTGVIRQYLPRINSTARRDIITDSEWPTNCDTNPDGFYVKFGATNFNYITTTGWGNWSLEACMPGNQTESPWRAVRSRQDFGEELYLNISLVSNDPTAVYTTAEERGGLFKFVLNTTAGYFELPNYMNGQRPGPLLDEDPMIHCSGDCAYQSFSLDIDS
jgi:hypothetical protein